MKNTAFCFPVLSGKKEKEGYTKTDKGACSTLSRLLLPLCRTNVCVGGGKTSTSVALKVSTDRPLLIVGSTHALDVKSSNVSRQSGVVVVVPEGVGGI